MKSIAQKIYIASDHAGFELKQKLISQFANLPWQDLGPSSTSSVDYPDYADKVCHKVMNDNTSMGFLICGSGQGMAMRANKYSNIRAALCWNTESATLSREHNAANVLCVGARLVAENDIFEIVRAFFATEFQGGRHQTRVDKLSKPTAT